MLGTHTCAGAAFLVHCFISLIIRNNDCVYECFEF